MKMSEKMVAKQFNTWYRYMFGDLLKTGGSTYSYEGKKDSGITVGGYGKTKYIVTASNLGKTDLLWFTHHVRRVVEEYEHMLANQNYYIGTWLDTETNELHIDIVKVFVSMNQARVEAIINRQESIYDLYRQLVIPMDDYRNCPYEKLQDDIGC